MVRRALVVGLVSLFAVGCGDSDKPKPGCTPKTCQSEGKNCGTMPDGCGQTITCGSCTAPQICGGGGANLCGAGTCTPSGCAAQSKNCGLISDNCADAINCGSCSAPQTCGGSGTPNLCGLGPDGGTAADRGAGKDGSASRCSAACMEQAGAECCTACGCTAAVKCTPICESGIWDCEMQACYKK